MTTPDNVTQKATMPSREFLVRQATLNALNGIYRETIPRFGMTSAAQDALHEIISGSFGNLCVNRVRHEFRTLTSRFQGGAEVVELINHICAGAGGIK